MSHERDDGAAVTLVVLVPIGATVAPRDWLGVGRAAEVIVGWMEPPDTEPESLAPAVAVRHVRLPVGIDLAEARRAVARHAATEWLVWIEPHERVTEQVMAAIHETIAASGPEIAGGSLLVRRTSPASRQTPEQIREVRLVRRDLCVAAAFSSCRALSRSLADQNWSVVPLSVTIERQPAGEEEQIRVARFVSLAADRRLRMQGKSAPALISLAESLASLADYDSARRCYDEALIHAAAGSTEQLEAWHGTLGIQAAAPKIDAALLDRCVNALGDFPLEAHLLSVTAGCLQRLGHTELALKSYEVAWRHGQIDEELWHVPEVREMAALCATLLLQILGRSDEAGWMLAEAMSLYPRSARLRWQHIELALRRGRLGDAMASAEQLVRCDQAAPETIDMVRGAWLARQHRHGEALQVLAGLYARGRRETLLLRWLSAVLILRGDLTQAAEVAAAWRDVEPENREARGLVESLRQQAITAAITWSDLLVQTPPVPASVVTRIDDAQPALRGQRQPAAAPALEPEAR